MSGVSISLVQGSGAISHNNREYINKNVDVERIKDNINYKNETLNYAYEKCFGDSVRIYNSKQKRNDRKINDYLDQIKKSKNKEKPFYETIVQVGDKYTNAIGTDEGEKAIDILDEYAKSFQERNPNLYVFNMKMHLDEATPHLHIDYIPVASGYKKGLEKRNSLTKAHQNMGINKGTGKNDNSTMKWQEKEREYLKDVCQKYKVKVIDKNVNREHLTVDEYKVQVEKIEKLYKENMSNDIEDISVSNVPLFKGKKLISEKDLNILFKNSKVQKFSRTKILDVFNKVELREKELDSKLSELVEEKKVLKYQVTRLNEKEIDLLNEKEKYEKKYNEQLNLNEKYLELKQSFDLVSNDLDNYKSVLSEVQFQNSYLKETNDRLYKENFDLKLIFEPLAEENKKLKIDNKEKEKVISVITENREDLENKNKNLHKIVENLKNENSIFSDFCLLLKNYNVDFTGIKINEKDVNQVVSKKLTSAYYKHIDKNVISKKSFSEDFGVRFKKFKNKEIEKTINSEAESDKSSLMDRLNNNKSKASEKISDDYSLEYIKRKKEKDYGPEL